MSKKSPTFSIPLKLTGTLVVLIISFTLMGLSYWSIENRNNTIRKENRHLVTITQIDNNYSRNLDEMMFIHKGERQSVFVRKGKGAQYKIGEQVSVFYDAKRNDYDIENSGLEQQDTEKWYFGELIGIGVILYWLYELYVIKIRKKEKQPRVDSNKKPVVAKIRNN